MRLEVVAPNVFVTVEAVHILGWTLLLADAVSLGDPGFGALEFLMLGHRISLILVDGLALLIDSDLDDLDGLLLLILSLLCSRLWIALCDTRWLILGLVPGAIP